MSTKTSPEEELLTDGELMDQLPEYIWKLYSTWFTKQQKTLFKQAFVEKTDHFDVETVDKFTHRNQLKRYFQHRYNDGYPQDYSVFTLKDGSGRVFRKVVVPKGCILEPQ